MPLASIDQFLNIGLQFNGARPSRFICSVTPPAISIPGTSLQKFQYTCKSANVPEATIGTVEQGYMGRKLKFSGDRTWQDWEVTVILDEDYVTRDMFESWMDNINAVEDNVMSDTVKSLGNGYTGYKGSIDIMHLSQQNNDIPIGHYNLVGAWPTMIGPIQLSWDNQNQISEFTVRFAYDDCRKVTANPISNFNIGDIGTGNAPGVVIPVGGV